MRLAAPANGVGVGMAQKACFSALGKGMRIASLLVVMRRLVAGFGVMALGLVAACGGNVAGGSQDPEGGEPGEPSEEKPNAPATPVDDHSDADTELGSCTLGPNAAQAYDRRCAWIAERQAIVPNRRSVAPSR